MNIHDLHTTCNLTSTYPFKYSIINQPMPIKTNTPTNNTLHTSCITNHTWSTSNSHKQPPSLPSMNLPCSRLKSKWMSLRKWWPKMSSRSRRRVIACRIIVAESRKKTKQSAIGIYISLKTSTTPSENKQFKQKLSLPHHKYHQTTFLKEMHKDPNIG